MFQGSMVAIVTPMNSDGSLDIKSFKGLLDYHIECKSDGVVVVGTSGEAPTMDVDEHTYLIKEAVKYIDGRIPVIAGSGANSTREAIFLTKKSKELGTGDFSNTALIFVNPRRRIVSIDNNEEKNDFHSSDESCPKS